MADLERLLHEAQYAFQSISFGESRENKRNASRAKSLCMKIIRRAPTSMEAGEAHAILRRLGEEAYASKMKVQHVHQTQTEHHSKPKPNDMLRIPGATGDDIETLNWSGLVAMIFDMPKALLALAAFVGIFLFGLFGPFLFIPLAAFVLFTGPFRKTMKPEQRAQMNAFIARANDYIDEQRR